MASAPAFDALTALPRRDPAAAELGRALAILLAAAGFEASVVEGGPEALWFVTRDGVHVRLATRAALPIPLHEDRVGDAVALLDQADPLLSRIEAALGLTLEPETLVPVRPAGSVMLAFAADGWSGLLAVPLDHPGVSGWEAHAARIAPAPGLLPVPLVVTLAGPRLPLVEAGNLAAGDLVLVAARPAATLDTITGDDARTGQLDLAAGSFSLQPHGAPMPDSPQDFAVPLTIRLPQRVISAASLAALRPGTSLPLGPLTDGMPVELLVAGRPLATGELVQLGDAFAVLIEERVALDAVDPAPVAPVADDVDAETAA